MSDALLSAILRELKDIRTLLEVQALDREAPQPVQALDRMEWLRTHVGEVPPGSTELPGS